jgi:hypothetical protein
MKIIYMNDTLVLMQDNAKEQSEFMKFIASGELKDFKEKPYLVITQ